LFLLLISDLSGQTANPFSVYRSDTIEASATEVSSEPAANEVDTKLEGDNPFNVSHIPIRKNQYEEIERLAISNRTVEENISVTYMPLWILIGSLCLLAYLFFTKKDHLAILIRSVLNDNFMRMNNYGHNGGSSVPYAVGYLIFLLNVALFIYLYVTKIYNYQGNYLYMSLLGIVLIFYLGRHLVNAGFSWIFNLSKELRLYDFTMINDYNLLSLFFLVFNIILVFGRVSWVKPVAIVAALFYIIALLSRYYKGLRIGQSQLNNYFVHFFLYFCAFEISPWVIVYSFVRDYVQV